MQRLVGLAVVALLVGCGNGGGTSLVEESTERADAACACEAFGCTTGHIAWFNKVSITQEGDLEALSVSDREAYMANSLRAADCQIALN
jgi:hypothetical protein